MPSHRVILTATLLGLLVGGPAAQATIDNLKSYKQAHPEKDPKTVSCKTCHEGAIGKATDLNAYGKALQQFKSVPGNAKKLTGDDFKAFEEADADQDGATNAQELEAGTDPLDAASKPAEEDRHSRDPSPGHLRAYLERLVMPEAWADSAADAPAPAKVPATEYVGTETCATCHAKQHKEFQQSTHARISIPEGTGAQGCEMCHGPGSLHVEAGGGRGVGGIINPRKDPSTCFTCHLDKKAEFRLPYHHPLIEGKMSCTDCHSPHAPDVRPWSATSLKDINEACFRCHKEQRGPFVWEHEALREGCVTCHKVHGAIHEKMLIARDNNLCLRCHTQTNFPTIGKSSHAGRLPQGTCFSAGCHTAVHGSNFDDHLRY